jgi:hypothetical protein
VDRSVRMSADSTREFIGELQRAVRTNDRSALAEVMNYPILITVDGSPSELVMHDAEEFVRNCDSARGAASSCARSTRGRPSQNSFVIPSGVIRCAQ